MKSDIMIKQLKISILQSPRLRVFTLFTYFAHVCTAIMYNIKAKFSGQLKVKFNVANFT